MSIVQRHCKIKVKQNEDLSKRVISQFKDCPDEEDSSNAEQELKCNGYSKTFFVVGVNSSPSFFKSWVLSGFISLKDDVEN